MAPLMAILSASDDFKTNKKVNEVMYFDSKSMHILKVYSIHYFN